MSGKLPILMVLGLGLVASMCAAVLMASLKVGGSGTASAPTTVEILVAGADVPGMTRIAEEMLQVREVAMGEVPEGAFTDPVQIVGKVLKNGLVAGQPIVKTVMLSDEGGAQLATSLPSGMRAVSVEINGSSAMKGLLFPGVPGGCDRRVPGGPGARPVGIAGLADAAPERERARGRGQDRVHDR